jgi:hypothetical protein
MAATSSAGSVDAEPSPKPQSIGREWSPTTTWVRSRRPWTMPRSWRSATVEATDAAIVAIVRGANLALAARGRPP